MKKRLLVAILIVLIVLVTPNITKAMRGNKQIVDITDKLPQNGSWKKRAIGGITDITLHHSASPNSQTAYDFARYHVEAKGWPGIGYHFVIEKDGTIHQTNKIESLSYHNGFNNANAIGVCLSGNLDIYNPTPAQSESLDWLVDYLKRKYPSVRRFVGHKEYALKTACPGKNINLNLLRFRYQLDPFTVSYKNINFIINNYNENEADN